MSRTPGGFTEPPLSVEAEQLLIGCILGLPGTWAAVRERLDPEWIYEPLHRRIIEAVTTTANGQGKPSLPAVITALADERGRWGDLDVPSYIQGLANVGDPLVDVRATLDLLRDLAVRRQIIARSAELASAAQDTADTRPPAAMLRDMREWADKLATGTSSTCDLPAVDLDLVADGLFQPQQWLINEWLPVGNAGVFSGPGSGGKSFLELVMLVCLAAGIPFLGYEAEPCPVLAYFGEDNSNQIAERLDIICRALGVDARKLKQDGRLTVVSTKGHIRTLFTAEKNSLTVQGTDWLHQIHDRARKLRARYLSGDNIARYCAIEHHASLQQVFSMFSQLDAVAESINGCIRLIHHPSKSGMKAIKADAQADAYDLVGGSAGLVNAPRFVHTLRWFQPSEEEEKFRLLQSHKANYCRPIALRLLPGPGGVVEAHGELDPDNLGGNSSRGSRGPKTKAERTLDALRDLYTSHRRAIALDELVAECIRVGAVREAEPNSPEWRDRRRTIRTHLDRNRNVVDARSNDTFCVKP